MEFTGRIMKVLGERSGTSQRTGNNWKTIQFVFEYFENPSDRYSDKVVLETYHESHFPLIVEGATVRIGFGHKVHEHEGKLYNDLNIYKFEALDGQQQLAPMSNQPQAAAPQADAPQPGQEQKPAEGDDLPF